MLGWSLLNDFLPFLFDLVFICIIVSTISVVVLDNRNPVKTMAWVLVLCFIPVVGLVFYVFFGRSGRKEHSMNKKGYIRLNKRPMMEFQQQKAYMHSEQHRLMKFFQNASNELPFEGNDLEVYTEGKSMFLSLIKEISKATHHIHLESYIFEDDALGRLIRDLLIDKVKQGVEVRVIYDDVGCWKVGHHFFEEMRNEGIETRSFLKVRFPLFTSKVNYRNHRKIIVIDGKVGFIGGMNIAVRYLKHSGNNVWRDTHLKIAGKAVYGLQNVFLTDWYLVDRTLITSSKYFPVIENEARAIVQIATSDPIGEWHHLMQGLLIAISNAEKYFYIQTPYLLPTEPVIFALKTAALSGVDVRVMIPEQADARLVHIASLSYLEDLLRAGVKIYLYQKGFLHSKMMVTDDSLSAVGTMNVDFRSFEHNFEVNAFVYDAAMGARMKEIFLNDQKDAKQLLLKDWVRRPRYGKVKESIFRLLAPLL